MSDHEYLHFVAKLHEHNTSKHIGYIRELSYFQEDLTPQTRILLRVISDQQKEINLLEALLQKDTNMSDCKK